MELKAALVRYSKKNTEGILRCKQDNCKYFSIYN